MKFLFDQSADFRLIAHLRSLGHDVTAVSRHYPHGLADEDVAFSYPRVEPLGSTSLVYSEHSHLLDLDRDELLAVLAATRHMKLAKAWVLPSDHRDCCRMLKPWSPGMKFENGPVERVIDCTLVIATGAPRNLWLRRSARCGASARRDRSVRSPMLAAWR